MAFAPRARFDWQLRTRTLALGERTLLMAIVNITPDSFSGDGLGLQPTEAAVAAAVTALDKGADIVDLGAESTRPNATPLSTGEEQQRLLPVLSAILRERPAAIVSVDTYHASTAQAAADAGAEIINDVSGLLWDPAMPAIVARTRCGLVLMHTRGRPTEWSRQSRLAPQEVMPTVLDGLHTQLAAARAAGIDPARIVLDPGFGFGKVGTENFALLAGLDQLSRLGRPVLAGLSRKGFLGAAVKSLQPADLPLADGRRTPTTAAQTAAILAGAHILRVHELQPAREAAAIADALLATR